MLYACCRRDMSSPVQPRWDLSPTDTQAVQQELRRHVVAEDDFGPVRFVADVDNSYVPTTATTCAGDDQRPAGVRRRAGAPTGSRDATARKEFTAENEYVRQVGQSGLDVLLGQVAYPSTSCWGG